MKKLISIALLAFLAISVYGQNNTKKTTNSRQQLRTNSLSLASQANQSVLKLF